jgi:hypothetical protein
MRCRFSCLWGFFGNSAHVLQIIAFHSHMEVISVIRG